MRRIVVTGSWSSHRALAADVEDVLVASSARRPLGHSEASGRYSGRPAGEGRWGDAPLRKRFGRPALRSGCRAGAEDQRKVDRFIHFALAAAEEALAQANWKASLGNRAPAHGHDHRVRHRRFPGHHRGGAHGGLAGVRRLSPFTIPSFAGGLAAGHISIRHGFKGPLGAPVTACAAGIQAIGDAARLIRANEADIAVCGGTEACMNVVSLGGFAAARSFSTGFNDTPTEASRPFDVARDGFVMGEGAGIL